MVANKCDMKDWVVSKDEIYKFTNKNKYDIIFTSAKMGENIDDAYNILINNMDFDKNLKDAIDKLESEYVSIDNQTNNYTCCY